MDRAIKDNGQFDPWPVALRVELWRPSSRELVVRIAKDKRGRIGLAKTVPFRPVLKALV